MLAAGARASSDVVDAVSVIVCSALVGVAAAADCRLVTTMLLDAVMNERQ